MRFKSSVYGGTVEILAADDFTGIPIKVAGTSVVKAGTPMTKGGVKATETEAGPNTPASTNADGILLYDVDPSENPNGTLVVQGVINKKKAKENSGVELNADTLKVAVPGIILRDNIGVNT